MHFDFGLSELYLALTLPAFLPSFWGRRGVSMALQSTVLTGSTVQHAQHSIAVTLWLCRHPHRQMQELLTPCWPAALPWMGCPGCPEGAERTGGGQGGGVDVACRPAAGLSSSLPTGSDGAPDSIGFDGWPGWAGAMPS